MQTLLDLDLVPIVEYLKYMGLNSFGEQACKDIEQLIVSLIYCVACVIAFAKMKKRTLSDTYSFEQLRACIWSQCGDVLNEVIFLKLVYIIEFSFFNIRIRLSPDSGSSFF